MRLPINIQVFVVRRLGDDYQYLMLHRHKTIPNFWQPVSGGVEEGEEIEATARREVAEETGVSEFTLHDPNYWRSYEVPEWWIPVHRWNIWDIKHNVAKVYVAEIDAASAICLDDNEHDEYRWCSFEETMNLLYWPGDKKALDRVGEYLGALAGKM